MKHLFSLLLGCLIATSAFSQATKHSYYGSLHTPKGELHGLVIFIGFDDTDASDDITEWKHDQIPEWSQGNYNEIFDIDDTQIGTVKNMTDYYYNMSEGQFVFTGEVFPEQIPVSPSADPTVIINEAVDYINANYTTYDWSRFDNRKNSIGFDFDNSLYYNTAGDPAGPDGKLDYVAFVIRDFTIPFFHGSTGTLGSRNVYYGGNTYTISSGNNSIGAGSDVKNYRTWFYHETAHNLYNSPHFFERNGTVGKYFYATSGWGFMASYLAPFDCANSWERWWCGWITPQEVTTNGTYVIKDYLTEGDAIRIPIPYDYTSAGETPQYLWIENHQYLNYYDGKPFYSEYAQPSPGLYMFVTARGDNRDDPNSISISNPNCNMIKSLNGEGKFDYTNTLSKLAVPGTGGDQYVFTKGEANPISGESDFQFIRGDYDDVGGVCEVAQGANQETDLGPDTKNDITSFFAENIGGTPTATYSVTGDANLAFVLNDELSLSGKYPILNYPQWDEALDEIKPYYLNGLNVKVTNFNPTTKEYTIEVSFDDWTVRSNKRWTGNIVLPENKDLFVNNNIVLTLDQSETVSRRNPDPIHGLYNPTKLNLKSGSSLTLKSGSTLKVNEYATLTVEDGAELIIEQNAKLEINSTAKVVLEPGGVIKCNNSNAKIIINNGGTLLLNDNDIQLNSTSARIDLKAFGIIETAANVDFTFTGSGYLYYYKDGIFDLGLNSNFVLQGSGDTDRKMWVGTNALLHIDDHNVTVNDCRLDYNSGSTFKMSGNVVSFDNVFVNDGLGTAGHAIYAYNTDELTVNSSDFTGFLSTILLEDIDVCPNDINVKIDYSTFVNHDFAAVEAYNVERMRFFTSSATGQTGTAAGLWLDDVDECLVDNSTITDYTLTSVDAGGIFCHLVGALILDGASIRDNEDGIEARASNIFVRNSAEIKDNTTGIYMMSSHDGTTNPTMMYRLVVGDEGCGWIINNYIGVQGEDILLDIDQQIHANASGDPFDIHPNRFDGNTTKAFEVCYDFYDVDDVSDPIPANHNYWTGGTAPTSSMYDIGFNPTCSGVDLDGTAFYSTQPTNCNCIDEDCDTEDTDENIQLRLSQTSCNYLINKNGGGRISIANQYRDGYLFFTAGDYNYAYQKFNWLKNRVESEYSNGLPDGVCKHLYISAITLKEISDILATVHCQYPFWINDREADFDINYGTQFLIFPNPAQTIITFGSLNGINANYTLYSLTGEMMAEGSMSGSVTLNISDYPKGVYFAVFSNVDGNVLETQKVILQ